MAHWLMKSEPDVYGIDHLEREGTTLWDGIRNYQARNYMRTMAIGDRAFFYHSNAKPPGIIGLMQVVTTGLVDPANSIQPLNILIGPRNRKPRAGIACAWAFSNALMPCSASSNCAKSSAPTTCRWSARATGFRSCP